MSAVAFFDELGRHTLATVTSAESPECCSCGWKVEPYTYAAWQEHVWQSVMPVQYEASVGWLRAEQRAEVAEVERDEAVALLREMQFPLSSRFWGQVPPLGHRVVAFLARFSSEACSTCGGSGEQVEYQDWNISGMLHSERIPVRRYPCPVCNGRLGPCEACRRDHCDQCVRPCVCADQGHRVLGDHIQSSPRA